jgi:molybdenum cofactor cytidylyltransferase
MIDMLSLIVLAAGKSSRMRGRNKLLSKVDGKPIVRRVVEAALNSKVDEVLVVVGWQSQRVRQAIADLPCRIVLNKEFEKGQSNSVKAGLREVGPTTQAILILPGDIVNIDPRSINKVLDEYASARAPLIVASHKGRSGHPILLDKGLFEEILEIDEQTFGLKSVVKKHATQVKNVETGSDKVIWDVDTPEDLNRVRNVGK